MSRFLITGVAGFIGSSLAHELVALGHQVRGIDNLSAGHIENLEPVLSRIDFRRVDVTDIARLRECMDGVDYVLHEAAVASVPQSIDDPAGTHAANVEGTFNVLLAARDSKVSRVVFAASSSAYGDQPGSPKSESDVPAPLTPYAAQKLAGEHYMRCFWHAYGLETVCLRYFNVYGPRQSATSAYSGVIARFVTDMLHGSTPTIFGDGEQSRDFTYIRDVVAANLLACQAPASKVAGQVFNIGTGSSQSLNHLYATVASVLGFRSTPKYAPPRPGDILHSEAAITKACSALGYSPHSRFEGGIEATIAWYIAQRKPEKRETVQLAHRAPAVDGTPAGVYA